MVEIVACAGAAELVDSVDGADAAARVSSIEALAADPEALTAWVVENLR